jgi:CBS domain-containing protein
VYLSAVLGQSLRTPEGRRVGRIADLVAAMRGLDPPLVVGVLVRRGRDALFVPAAALANLDTQGAIAAMEVAPSPFQRRSQEFLLGRDFMDSEVVDLARPRVVRVNEVLLERAAMQWQVSGVDVGVRALLRRIFPRGTWRSADSAQVVPWAQIELLAAEVPGGTLLPDHRRLSRLHPADIARVADAVPSRLATEIVASLDDELAADTMEEMIDEKQADVIGSLDPDRAAGILERMAPDAAADVLAELEPELVDAVLQRMDPAEAGDVHALLTYPHDTAGGLMTTDYVIAPRDLRVGDAPDYLRAEMQVPEWVYYVYVVEEPRDRRLLGTVSLRDLFLAAPDQTCGEIMTTVLRSVGPEEKATVVARLMSDYNLLTLPVVDQQGRLLGIVSMDDALEVVLPSELRRQLPRVFR